MKTAQVMLESVSTIGFGRNHDTPKLEKESPADYAVRTWRQKAHTDPEGTVIIPANFFKNCLTAAAGYMSEKIKGKNNKTWTQKFKSGVLVPEDLSLGVRLEDMDCVRLFLPADGKPGGKVRVWKMFPILHKWRGLVTFYILDDIITKDIFLKTLGEAGKFIGLGFYRPSNNGTWGRFGIQANGKGVPVCKWEEP